MIVRHCAEFKSSLPDDTVEDETGIVQFGGQNVAAAVCEILGRLGCKAGPPEYAGEHGWDFEVLAPGGRFLCQVTNIDDHLLQFINPSWWDKVRRRYPPAYLETLSALGRELAVDPRFSDVRWYTSEDLHTDRPGASQPVEYLPEGRPNRVG